MLYEEAQWVGNKIQRHFKKGDKVLNLGSSTKEAREIRQPHMKEFIFKPARTSEIEIVHTDISNGDGVDIVGDLTDPSFLNELKKKGWNGLLCCNLLEHLEDRQPIIDAIIELLQTGDKLIMTVPYNYPYHLDPIDTMYRPSIDDLKQAFPDLKFLEGEELIARRKIGTDDKTVFHKNYFQQLKENPSLFAKLILRSLIPFYKPKMWWITVRDMYRMFKPFSVTVAVFEK